MAAAVTLAPPDVVVSGVSGARVNLYLLHVEPSPALRNEPPPSPGKGAYGQTPLALGLRYLLSSHSALETNPDADLNAQTLLGDAMRVLHQHGSGLRGLRMQRAVAGRMIGDPVLDPELSTRPTSSA